MNLFRKLRSYIPRLPGFKYLVRWILRFRLVGQPLVNAEYITYSADDLISKNNCEFMKDPRFSDAYTKGVVQQWGMLPVGAFWLFHVTQWAAYHAKNLTGDFVECGTFRGAHAMSTMTYVDFKSLRDRKYYLFDTFEGLVPEYSTEEEYAAYDGEYSGTYDFVVGSFKEFPNVVIVKGPVPDT